MKNKAVFLDRDGVINKNLFDVKQGIKSPSIPSEFILLPRAKRAVNILKKEGFKIAVVSNQPGIATGAIRKAMLDKITQKMTLKLNLDGVYYCIHHPKFSKCSCRKPKDGLLKTAEKDLDIDMKNSYIVGDNITDIQAGKNCKKKILVAFNFHTIKDIKSNGTIPDYFAYDLYDAAKIIKRLERG